MPGNLGFPATRRTVFDGRDLVRKVGYLTVDNEFYADKLISLVKDALKYSMPGESRVITMFPAYISGTTLKTANKG